MEPLLVALVVVVVVLIISHQGSAAWVPGPAPSGNDSGRVELQVNPNHNEFTCTLYDFRVNTTVELCGLLQCPCSAIQPGINAASLLIDVAAAAPSNVTSVQVGLYSNGVLNDTFAYPLPTVLEANVHVLTGAYHGPDNTELFIQGHSVSLIGTIVQWPTLLGRGARTAPFLTITNCKNCSISNFVISAFEVEGNSATSLVELFGSTFSVSNCNLQGLYGRTMDAFQVGSPGSPLQSFLSLSHVNFDGCQLRSLILADSPTDFSGDFLTISQSNIGQLGVMHVTNYFRLTDFSFIISKQSLSSDFLVLLASEGVDITLDGWHMSDVVLSDSNMVSLYGAADGSVQVSANRWTVKNIRGRGSTLLAANICTVTASDWDMTNSEVSRAIALAHCVAALSHSTFDNVDVVSLFEGGATTSWAMTDVTVTSSKADRAIFDSGEEDLSSPPAQVTITGCSFLENIRGPVLQLYHCDVEIAHCQFIDNAADFRIVGANHAGSISITDTAVIKTSLTLGTTNKFFGSVSISNSHFYGTVPNLLQFNNCKGGLASISITDTEFTNYALHGRAYQFTLSECTFSNSEAFLGETQPVNSVLLNDGTRVAWISQCRFQPGPTFAPLSSQFVYVGQPGAIVVTPVVSATVNVSRCHFEEKFGYQGAGIFTSNADVVVDNCFFSSMVANSGAGIFTQGGTLTVRESLFLLNTAEQEGGDISVTGDTTVLFSALECYNSTSLSSGGSLYFSGTATGTVSGATVRYSSAVQGAAITTAGRASVRFVDSTFSNGTSTSSGGAVSTRQSSEPQFVGCFLGHNSATSYGGAVLAADTSSPSFIDCTFKHNSVLTSGGSLYAQDSSTLYMEGTLVTGSFADSVGGGVAVVGNASLLATNCNVTGNLVGLFGGGLGASDKGKIVAMDCIVNGNSGTYGGGIGLTQFGSLKLFSSQLVGNTATSGAGIRASGQSGAFVQGCTFIHNDAIRSGGALSSIDQVSIGIVGCTFSHNRAASGGAISSTTLLSIGVFNSNFTHNFASYGGGAVSGKGNLHFKWCTFSSNEASRNGGALSLGPGPVIISESAFTLNAASGSGGAFAGVGTYLIMSSVSLIGNSADNDGGAFHLAGGHLGEALNCNFTANTAPYGQAGAFFLDADRFQVYNSSFDSNTALLGGAVVLMLPSDYSEFQTAFISVLFMDNLSLTSGGAVAVIARRTLGSGSGLATCHDSVCEAPLSAPPVTPSFGPNAFVHCQFVYNEATASGGAVYLKQYFNGEFQLSNCTFEGNAAGEYGGGVFLVTAGTEPLLVNATFVDNFAFWGGSTIGVDSAEDPATVSANICDNCEFQLLPNDASYETSQGYATPPATLAYAEGTVCPGIQTLDGMPFTIDIGMRDSFGTPVQGEIFGSADYLISFSWNGTDCSVTSPATGDRVIDDSGVTTFLNVTMEGKSNSTCVLQFAAMTSGGGISLSAAEELSVSGNELDDEYPSQKGADLVCQIILGGCSGDGQVVQAGDAVDTCVDESVWGVFIVVGLLLCLLALVCLLFVVILMHHYRERQRIAEESYYEDLEIADDIMNKTSLEDILNDPAITRIPWEELEMGERIGRGASGIVSSAVWRHNGEEIEVAMKELTLQLEEMDEQAAQDFLVEIRLMNALRHSRVVRFEGVAFNAGQLYLVTELMQFGSVKDVMLKKGRNLSWKVRTKLLHDAAMGMQYLHSKKLIHRDLKPQNLLVNNKWVCKVADFGVSTIKTTTRTMTAIGTPVYMAPEVLNNERYSETADVYSFGIVVAEVYTGRQPYHESGLNDAQLLYKIYHDALRPSTEGLPHLARQLVEEAVTREPSLRPTFAELVLRLKRLSKLVDAVPAPGQEDDSGGGVELELGLYDSGASLGVINDTGGSLGLDSEDLNDVDSLQRTGGSINAEMLR